jgi:hypothetical protein
MGSRYQRRFRIPGGHLNVFKSGLGLPREPAGCMPGSIPEAVDTGLRAFLAGCPGESTELAERAADSAREGLESCSAWL